MEIPSYCAIMSTCAWCWERETPSSEPYCARCLAETSAKTTHPSIPEPPLWPKPVPGVSPETLAYFKIRALLSQIAASPYCPMQCHECRVFVPDRPSGICVVCEEDAANALKKGPRTAQKAPRSPEKPKVRATSARIRRSRPQKAWAAAIKARDQGICQECGQPGNIAARHEPLRKLLKDLKLNTMDQVKDSEAFWDLSHGRILCQKCFQDDHPQAKILADMTDPPNDPF